MKDRPVDGARALRPTGGAERCVNPTPRPKRYLTVVFDRCPIGLSLGVLGRKWSLLILRDIGAYGIDRFNRLLESIPGLPPKVLSTRLRELERLGLIQKVEERRSPILVRWDLTERGRDLIPVMMMVTAFQSKWNPELLHPGRPPMRVRKMYDREAMALLRGML
ncbi:MAG TPA: helix-turn-helix domain-containing protein [Thermoplasmata archaeon]|nr:helix-turn-helix domain-containing protein [Thermoplasmata archaeon]